MSEVSNTVSQDTCAVIVAGGLGVRFGDERGKQYAELAGAPIISWTVSAFDKAPSIASIVVVCPAGRIDETRLAVEAKSIATPASYVEGGTLRQDSCWAGIQAVPAGLAYIAIHDAARPLIRPLDIENVIAQLRADLTLDGAIAAHRATDTLKVVEDDLVTSTPDRSLFWMAQTPQVFRYDSIVAAYKIALAEDFVGTDDASIMEYARGHVRCVEAPADNFKVTVPEDRIPVEAILLSRQNGGFSC